MRLSNKLACWKEIWSVFMADPEFREHYTGTHDFTVGKDISINRSQGTLRLPGTRKSGEDHFIAFKKYTHHIEIFDPADTSGRYNSFLNDTVKYKIMKMANRSVRVVNWHPQCHDGDTFCQTWSLAWLKPSLRKYITTVKTKQDSIVNMYKLCSKIAKSRAFSQYMLDPGNVIPFQKLISKTCKEYKTPQMSVREFVDMSKNIKLRDIKEIYG